MKTLSFFLALLLCGCSAAGGEEAHAEPAGRPEPGDGRGEVYVEMEYSLPGPTYAELLAQCREIGAPVIEELSAEDARKAGRAIAQLVYGPRLNVVKKVKWELDTTDSSFCQFRIKQTAVNSRGDGRTFVEAVSEHGGPFVTTTSAGNEYVNAPRGPDENAADPVPGGFRKLGERVVAGQKCLAWRNEADGIEECVWSAGPAYGRKTTPTMHMCEESVDGPQLLLHLKLGPEQPFPCELHVTRMTVGQPVPPSALDVGSVARVL